MQIRTYTYELIDSKMYIMIEGSEALIIDPCISEDAVTMLRSEGVDNVLILLTHEHYDHMSGLELFRDAFSSCSVLVSEICNTYMQKPTRNGSKYFKALFIDKESDRIEEAGQVPAVSYTGDEFFAGETQFDWQEHKIFIRETPGHSPGSVCIIIDDSILFTGDSLLKDDPVVVKLPGGNRKDYNEYTVPYLKSLDEELMVYPGHGEGGVLKDFKIGEV